MSEEQNGIDVYQSNRFESAMNKLHEQQQKVVEDEIDKIIDNPEIGQLKKGDLSHLRVHKFKIEGQLALMGYTWIADKLEIYLLQLGSHENFYEKMKDKRKSDLRLIK